MSVTLAVGATGISSEDSMAGNMHRIRPYRLFTLLDGPASERIAHVQIPPRRGGGGLTLLETFVVVSASRLVESRRIFEFGTFLGATTLNLALNSSDDTEVLTLDLDEDCAADVEQDIADAPLTKIHLDSKAKLDFSGTDVNSRIETLTGNSITFDFSAYRRTCDFVFIDGGHDLKTVRADSENAFAMVQTDRPACIMWHDYGNRDYPELTGYLDGLARTRPMFHVGDTMLCAWFHDPAGTIVPPLLREE